jgi:DNA replication initiation complex subunit (GINS family)
MAEEARMVARDAREPEQVSYESLQDLLRAERRSNKLMPLPPRYWAHVRDFLQGITDAFRLEQARDPFSRQVMVLTDKVKNARHAAESVWALRERKLSMLALAATKDRKQPDGITPDEAELYRNLLSALDEGRGRVFQAMPTGAAEPPKASPPSSPPVQMPVETAPSPAPPKPAVVPPDTKQEAEMVTIRALGDIPPFVGPDMQTYLLKAGDIATVPPSIANLLVRRSKAAIVEA